MTSYDRLHKIGIPHFLARHFGNPETTLIEAERWVVPNPEFNKTRARRPDLLIAFGVSPDDYDASNGYIVSEQGKPPDFVMEIASESTADVDTGVKREYYAELGIPEYWRFDKTDQHHGARLAGDRLVDGRYEPIPIEEPEEGILQGYSAALNLILRWEEGELRWHDPETGRHILTYDDQRAARVQERDRADTAETHADQERNRADQEHAARAESAEALAQSEREARVQAGLHPSLRLLTRPPLGYTPTQDINPATAGIPRRLVQIPTETNRSSNRLRPQPWHESPRNLRGFRTSRLVSRVAVCEGGPGAGRRRVQGTRYMMF